ncbi:MBL fold metallo-hydrolase [Arthrobacter gengyunqii]|uniref:MBL fold metallo-hydrolase n=1 Tax=Arthrobacter gengyunqii TaxID=2886940 RepID=A0A9X1S6Z5_9MICC|nr:MBL fold metallo-hydrolase [Arthrobacter gengyunqii]MCC3269487.1 MBL fold metallo-hydrolase [Arthrobacter gengyunqii]UOY97675.1 MBL fold metallo-hydrolase [Arthrobacter gengyunqii]
MSKKTLSTAGPVARPLPTRWIHGSESSKHNTDPDVQVYWYDADTVVLRQNKAINYEAPFLFLLFGSVRVVLLDTGATVSEQHFPLRTVVDNLIDSWMSRHPGVDNSYELLILHTHSHGDHIAGDAQFFDRASTTLVPADRTSAWHFLGLSDTSDKTQLDLGGRLVDILATPGHDAAAVTFYDPWTGILFTGDTVYRGRLYISDWPAFSRSIDLLIDFCRSHPVTYVLGCHIEMTSTPGLDYPVRTTYQPDEPPLEMTVEHLHMVRSALDAAGPEPVLAICDEFILWPTK